MSQVNVSEYTKNIIRRSLCIKLAVMKYNKLTGQSIHSLKPKQIQALTKSSNNDVLVTLPTGYGKSIIFEVLPYFSSLLRQKKSAVIIVSPLNAIILEKMELYGDLACHVSTDLIQELSTHKKDVGSSEIISNRLSRFYQGDFTYVIGHPEELLHPLVLSCFKSDVWNAVISHIVVDEAHCIVSWGESFRLDFQRLGTLRAQLYTTKVIAMTATATLKMKKEIARSLNFSDSYQTVEASPDRANIMYMVKQRAPITGGRNAEDSYRDILLPIFQELKENPNFYPKTVVYTKLKWCGYAHELACQILGPVLQHHTEEGDFSACVAQFHAPQTPQMKESISKAMRNPLGPVRVLFATQAYGMGADAPNIRNVIHIGPSSTPEGYVQETGRAGRDGEVAVATIYCNASDLASNVTHLCDEMREYCKTKRCRREALMQYFGFEAITIVPKHLCCDNCMESCSCEECRQLREPEAEFLLDELAEAFPINLSHCVEPNDEAKVAIRLTLGNYFKTENSVIEEPLPELLTGLCDSLASAISSDYINITDIKDLKKHAHIKECYAQNIISIINYVNSLYHDTT